MSNNHGGNRAGSGRKPLYNQPTKVMRVPESAVNDIKLFLNQYKGDIQSIFTVTPQKHISIPLALEKVSAGPPSNTEGYLEKPLDMNDLLIQNEIATFAVKVASLSMLNAGINIDDILIVDRSLQANHKDIVIAVVDNEFTVKRLMMENNTPWLKAENPDFADIHLKEHQELMIWGVVTYAIKPFKRHS